MKALDIGKFSQICLDIEKEQDKQGNFGNALCVGELRKFISSFPAIEAVPLDMLCEWLSRNAFAFECEDCEEYCKALLDCEHEVGEVGKVGSNPEYWKNKLTKWMEEQDDTTGV